MPHCSGKKQKSYQQKLDKDGNAWVSQTFNTSGTVADRGTVFNARRLLFIDVTLPLGVSPKKFLLKRNKVNEFRLL